MSSRVVVLTCVLLLAAAALIGLGLMSREAQPDAVSGLTSDSPSVPSVSPLAPEEEGELPARALAPVPTSVKEGRRVERTTSARLSGMVVNLQGVAIEGARLRLVRSGVEEVDPPELQSDAQGHFSWQIDASPLEAFEGLEVWAEHDFYLPARVAVSVRDEQAECRIEMSACPRVTGRFVDLEGTPVSARGEVHVEVRVLGETDTRHISLECDEQGRFESRGLPLGRLLALRGRSRGWKRSRMEHDVLLEAESVHHLDLALDPGWILRGVVLEKGSDRPIPYAQVFGETWQYSEDGTHPAVQADDQGRFELRGLGFEDRWSPPDFEGREFAVIDVTAKAEGFVPSPLERQAVVLPDDSRIVEDVEIYLDPAGCRFEGIALMPDGVEPAEGLTVYALDAKQNVEFARTGQRGRFEFDGLPAGRFDLLLWCGDETPPAERIYAIHRTELEPGMVAPVTIVCGLAKASIEGRLVDLEGQPREGITVAARSRFRAEGLTMGIVHTRAETDSDGRYRIEHLLEGACGVHVEGFGDASLFVSDPDGQQIELSPEERRRGVDFVVTPSIVVAGKVSASDVSGLRVLARTAERGESACEVQADGSFRFPPLWPAAYDLVVERDGQVVARSTVGSGGASDLLLVAAN